MTDIHVCNNTSRSGLVKTRNTGPDDLLYAGKTAYPIEAYGEATVQIRTPAGSEQITLMNVALAPGFMTNLVCLRRLNDKGVHWFSKFPLCLLTEEEEYFCDLESVGDHLVLQRDTNVLEGIPEGPKTCDNPESDNPDRASYGTATSTKSRFTTITGAQMHRVLGHASPEVISHVESAGADLKVDNSDPPPQSINCETCSTTKATQIIS